MDTAIHALLRTGWISFHESGSITRVAVFCVDEISLHQIGYIQLALRTPLHDADRMGWAFPDNRLIKQPAHAQLKVKDNR